MPVGAVYFRNMALFARLALILAVLLMPFGMAPAPASAPHHSMAMAPTAMQHCPDGTSGQSGKGGIADCAMACAAALPAGAAAAGAPLVIVCDRAAPGVQQRLNGLHPETVTPPPKRT